METYNNTLCVTHAELLDGIITSANLKNLLRADRGSRVQVVRSGGNGRTALYAVNSLPPKYREAVRVRYGSEAEQAKARAFVDRIIRDMAAEVFYQQWKIDGVRGLTTEQRTLLANSANILNALREILDDAAAEQRKVGRRNRIVMSEWWEAAAEVVQRASDVYPHILPSSGRTLQRKYKAYFANGARNYDSLISGKYGNKSAAKVATEEQVAWITQICKFHTNLNCAEVAERYNTVCDAKGWKPITRETVWRIAQKYKLEIAPWKYGKSDFENNLTMQVKRSKPTSPMLFWSIDGWTANAYYVGTRGGKKNAYQRLTMVVVIDTFNNYPIGYAIGDHECVDLIKAALCNALDHTRELFGMRYKPDQLQSDHYAVGTLKPTYELVTSHFTPPRVGNAKAKPIERYFSRVNSELLKEYFPDNWSGRNITTDPRTQPNREWLNANKKKFPDRDEAYRQLQTIMEDERKLKLADYMAGWEGMAPERRLPMAATDYLLAFGETTGRLNALAPSGLHIKLLGERRTYDSFDIEFRRHTDKRWAIKYDPSDLSEVLAVSEDGAYRFPLQETHVQPMALSDREYGDYDELQRVFDYNDNLRRHVAGFHEKSIEIIREGFAQDSLLDHPDVGNEYITGMLTDFKGQNKDPKSRKRLGYGDDAEEVAYEETKGAGGKLTTYDLY